MKTKHLTLSIVVLLLLISSIVLLYLFKDEILDFSSIIINQSEDLKEFAEKLNLKGYIFIVLFQTIQVLITILPSEPVLILSSLAYGPVLGGILCVFGVFLANQIIYLFSKYKIINKNTKKQKKKEHLEKQIARSNRNINYLVLLLYILPLISFGLIAIIYNSTKPKWWKYTLFTTLGSLFPIFTATFIYDNLASQSPNATFITIMILITLCIIILLYKDKILEKIYIKTTAQIKIDRIRSKKPNRFLYFIFLKTLTKRVKLNNLNIIDNVGIKDLKSPFIVISNHPSRIDYLYIAYAFKGHRLNFVTDYYVFQVRFLHTLLKKLGAIPKKLFQSDPQCVKNMLRIIKKKGNICFFPDGILSQAGTNEIVNKTTSKFLLKMNTDVIVCRLEGAYLTRPKHCSNYNIGKINLYIDKLDLNKFNTKELLDEELERRLSFNDFDFIKNNKDLSFIGSSKTLKLDGILYYCPKCKTYYNLRSNTEKLYCLNCNLEVKIDDRYNFIFSDNINYFENISTWYNYQKELIKNEIKDDFIFNSPVKLKIFSKKTKLNPEVSCGCGDIIINSNEFIYKGTRFDKDIVLKIPIENLIFMSFKGCVYFELYYQNNYYAFYPENGYITCYIVLLCQMLCINKIN